MGRAVRARVARPRLVLLTAARGPDSAGLLRRLSGGNFWPADAEALGRSAGQARAGMRVSCRPRNWVDSEKRDAEEIHREIKLPGVVPRSGSI